MADRQTKIRSILNDFIKIGFKARVVANEIGIHESILSRFRYGKLDLKAKHLDSLDIFLEVNYKQ